MWWWAWAALVWGADIGLEAEKFDHLALVVADGGWSPLEVVSMSRPRDPQPDGRCRVLVAYAGGDRATATALECDEPLKDAALAAASAFQVRPPVGTDQSAEQKFRITAVSSAGTWTWRFDDVEIEGPRTGWPGGWVTTWKKPVVWKRGLPKWPKSVPHDKADRQCKVDAQVDAGGRPTAVVVEPGPLCPAEFAAEAERAVKKTRWDPALQDGAPFGPVPMSLLLKFRGM